MQEELILSLYDCLYGTVDERACLDEYGVRYKCMKNVIKHYKEAHANGKEMGPVNINEIMVHCTTGEMDFPERQSVEKMLDNIDTIKCLPPGIIRDSDQMYDAFDDQYCLALLLFIVRYNAFPFDGKLVCENPVVTRAQAMKLYGNPVFIFDDNNTENEVFTEQSGAVIEHWYRDENLNIKTLFLQMFTIGISDNSYSIKVNEWEDVIEDFFIDESERKSNPNNEKDTKATNEKNIETSDENNGIDNNKTLKKEDEINYIETEDVKIGIIAGKEIYERDFGIDTEENRKICVVVKNNKDARILALGNCTDDTWSLYLPNTKEILVKPNSVAPVIKGSMISIGEIIVNIS
ncbi:MAG: hypothetical protein II919_04385 [Lachnospiraceae bacterium]|nr:hypothetical protein [Lachnospiraceae bacterium]